MQPSRVEMCMAMTLIDIVLFLPHVPKEQEMKNPKKLFYSMRQKHRKNKEVAIDSHVAWLLDAKVEVNFWVQHIEIKK